MLIMLVSACMVECCIFFAVLEYAEHGDLFASWCCTPNRQVPLEITRLYSSEIALALGAFCVCVCLYVCLSVWAHACIERTHVYSCT